MKVAVTGASGLIGSALAASLRASGDQVVTLVRRSPPRPAEIAWDPLAARGGLAPGALDGTDAVVHLAGAGVADHRWTDSYKEEIRSSRVQGTQGLSEYLAAMDQPPAVLLSGSAIGWYGDTGGREVDESAPAGTSFLAGVVRDWEAAAGPARQAGIRVATLRTGIVISRHGGVLARLLLAVPAGPGRPARPGHPVHELGGPGRLDRGRPLPARPPGHLRAGEPDRRPNPDTNAAFTAALADALHRPALLSIPSPVLSVALGGVTSDLMTSARVLPRVLGEAGYEFTHPGLASALAAELQPAGSAA